MVTQDEVEEPYNKNFDVSNSTIAGMRSEKRRTGQPTRITGIDVASTSFAAAL